MPPSPSLRFSPGRELRGDNHKRGRSLEGRTLFKEKDDDLALFNEMETRERENFLLESNDDFEDILSSKMRYFSSNKLGVSIPVRGESSDLLNADGEKSDYDWLLTPPDTPLFRSLDDEAPAVMLVQRGRPRSKPITISRSSTMGNSYISSRGSASPNRLSPSPRSGNSSIQSRGRPSSAPLSSPTPSLRGTTPPRGPSPPPKKPSTPVPRSSTPASRRMGAGPGGNTLSFGKRGASPVNKTRGNSASPKAKVWQANIPGFSLEAPPNLRTSLRDRPASYVRGSSPASRNSRQSMSPTASRSASSSYSHDRDRIISHGKGSVASSGDDDADSLHSIPVNSLDRPSSRRGGAYASNHAPSLSRKSTRPGLSSSAPKRSSDSALRQMDHHRKGPQNMFRPLLSSVPSSSFYVGKSASAYRSLISRNSSVTTSSNASSDQGPTGVHEVDGLDHNQDDTASTHGKAPCTDVEDDIFVLEKTDSIDEDVSPMAMNGGPRIASQVDGPPNLDPLGSPMVETGTPEIFETKSKFLEVNGGVEDKVICSECGQIYPAMELTDGELNICPDCRRSGGLLTTTSEVPAVIVSEVSRNLLDDYTSFDALETQTSVAASSGMRDVAVMSSFHCDENVDETHIPEPGLNLSSHNSTEEKVSGENVQQSPKAPVIDLPAMGHRSSDGDNKVPHIQRLNEIPNLKLDVSEGTGISVLLKRSSSGKGPFVQSRSFTATSISFDDLSYVRDCPPSMRSSTSSFDVNIKHRRSGSSLSGTSSHTFHALGTNNNEITVAIDENEVGTTNAPPEEQTLASERARFDHECAEVCHDCGGTVTNTLNATDSAESSARSFLNADDFGAYGDGENFQHDAQSVSDEEHDMVESCDGDLADLVDIPTHSQLETISEMEIENGHPGSPDSHMDDVGSSDSCDNSDELQEPSLCTRSCRDAAVSVAENDISDHAHGILEESTATVEFGTKAKSLTLEEATDAILFCSSIVHDLAYEAATIAIEKENSVPFGGSHPPVAILGSSNSNNIREPHGRTSAKRTPKSPKTRKRRTETETETKPSSGKDDNAGTSDKSTTRIVGVPDRGDSMKPPKLESKCNCAIM